MGVGSGVWLMLRRVRFRWLRRLVLFVTALVLVAGGVFYVQVVRPMRDPHPAVRPVSGVIAVMNATIYVSPDVPPLVGATLVVRDGKIAAVGRDAAVPPDAQRLPCDRCVVTAGFWNSHIHLTEPKWSGADSESAAVLDAQLADMLTSRGFTTVVDLGSDPRSTLSLRRRIAAGELHGPAILTAERSLYPPNGIPYYLGSLPWLVRKLMPQPSTAEEAAAIEEQNIERGADVLKLFTGSYIARGKVLPMPELVARAAADVAHKHGQLVFSHASNVEGAKVAIHGGVDVLAHALDDTEGVDAELLRTMVERHMAMIPTLKMFGTTVTTKPEFLDPIIAEVRQFRELGGQLLFGTDVGYMTDYTTDDEFRALARAGLDAPSILRTLTTAPAERFGVQDQKGSLTAGRAGDFVVLDGDPAGDVTAFARVRATVAGGRVIFQAAAR